MDQAINKLIIIKLSELKKNNNKDKMKLVNIPNENYVLFENYLQKTPFQIIPYIL